MKKQFPHPTLTAKVKKNKSTNLQPNVRENLVLDQGGYLKLVVGVLFQTNDGGMRDVSNDKSVTVRAVVV